MLKKITLNNNGVNAELLVDETRPTSCKQRFRLHQRSVFRLSCLSDDRLPTSLEAELSEKALRAVEDVDLLIFSDFNYGLITRETAKKIISKCNSLSIPIIDCQASSQIGDLAKYKGVTCVTPTEHEARLMIGSNDDGLVQVATKIRAALDCNEVLITLGEQGALAQTTDKSREILTDQIAALNTKPVDVSGAGDSLLVGASVAKLAGASIWEMAAVGSFFAAVQTSRHGNIPISNDEIMVFAKLVL